MRPDSAGAKTWLLGAIASWAVCFWVLTLFGLGGRVDRLPEDPDMRPALPMQAKAPPERLQALGEYSEVARRPLFSTNRKPQAFFVNPEGDDQGSNGFDYVLTSVMIAPGFEMAIVQPAAGGDSVRIKVGDALSASPAWSLVSIGPRSAVFNGPDGERTLELRVFDGVGGEAPTAIAGTRADDMPTGAQPADDMGISADARPGSSPGAAGTPTPNPPAMVSDATDGMPEPATVPPDNPDQTSADQVDAIRKRIEERRARLRDEAPTSPSPSQKP